MLAGVIRAPLVLVSSGGGPARRHLRSASNLHESAIAGPLGAGFLVRAVECLLDITHALLDFAFHLFRRALGLLVLVTSQFSNLSLDFACRILRSAFYLIAVYGVLAWFMETPIFPRYIFALVAILAIPLVRLSAAPLALAWNRHR